MIIRNGLVFSNGAFVNADLAFENGIITKIETISDARGESFDAAGAYVLPGFVDIHTHGCVGVDFCDADPAGLEKMLAYYGSCGVTSVVLTTMSYGEDLLRGIIGTALRYLGKNGYGAVLRGINLEGPFINKAKSGAQNPDYIVHSDADLFDRLYAASEGCIRLFNIAPELPGSLELIHRAARSCTVSLAHTAADYETAASAFNAGASHVAHLFNAMPGFAHREPGVIGAAFDCASFVEIISDGVHLHPSVIRAMFRMFGPRRICLVSDSTRGTGMPNGRYELGGQAIEIKDGRSNLVNGGNIAGSAVNLLDCFRHAVKIGIPLEDAVPAASYNPAQAASISSVAGSLSAGRSADILILDTELRVIAVFAAGERVDVV